MLVLLAQILNVVVFTYGKGTVRTALDEAARAGARDGLAACEATADQVLGDLLGGALGADVQITCTDAGRRIVATADRALRRLADLARRLRRHLLGVGGQGGPVTVRRFRAIAGQAAIELPLGVALLLLPIAIVVMVVPQWPERQTVATAAAKEAATLYATADNPERGRRGRPGGGRPGRRQLRARRPGARAVGGAWCRGCTVTANVTVDIPAVQVPFIGTIGNTSWTATSSARIEDYASLMSTHATPRAGRRRDRSRSGCSA